MTYRQRHRQNLLRTIELWLRRHGAYFIFALCFSLATANAATEESKKTTAKPASLMQILSDKDLLEATAPAAAKPVVAKKNEIKPVVPAVKSETKKAAPAVKSVAEKPAEDAKKKDVKVREKKVSGIVMFIKKKQDIRGTAGGG